jgi:hypothetical protein
MKRAVSLALVLIVVTVSNARTLCESYCIPAKHDVSACHDDPGVHSRIESKACANPFTPDVFVRGEVTRPPGPDAQQHAVHSTIHSEPMSVPDRVTTVSRNGPDLGTSPPLVSLRI